MSPLPRPFRCAAGVFLTIVIVASGLGFASGCGGSSKNVSPAAKPQRLKSSDFAGGLASPQKPAPPLSLRDNLGRPVSLSQYRGKAMLVTFIYTHCPDVCPLIVGNLRVVQAKLGPEAKKMQIVAVSTDPRGDTPKSVSAFLRAHDMTGHMEYLIGSRRELSAAWKRWGIVAKPDKANPELVEHSALVYGISASGKVTTLYPSNFKPAAIAHDVPKLATL
jgi:protein SCO1/2